MTADRLQQALERALAEAFEALDRCDWKRLDLAAQTALALDPANAEASRLVAVARLRLEAETAAAPAPVEAPPMDRASGVAPAASARAPARRQVRARPRRSVASVAVVADHVAELVPFPAIAAQVIQLSDDETSTIDQLARLIAADPALTVKVLSTANSAYYHRGQRITTIREALVVLGAREVRALTLATCVMDGLGESYVISTDDFWRFSLTVALLAELLARADRMINGDAFTVGILHGIGLLALDLYWPDGLQEVLSIDDPRLRRLADREHEVFGFTSAEVGAELALRWRLPRPIVQAIANQGMRADELERGDRLSGFLVRARIFARFSGMSDGLERSEPRPPPQEWLEPPLSTALSRIGGIEGILERVDAFLGVSSETQEPAA